MKNLLIAFSYITVAYVMVWLQLFGSLRYTWIKENHWWFIYAISVPIAFFMTQGTHIAFTEMKDSSWSVRFISFVINTFIFSFMSYVINHEGINIKTSICLGLSLFILGIQLFWK